MFYFDKDGRPKVMTTEEMQEKMLERLVPGYKEIMEMNKNGGRPNPHNFEKSFKEAPSNYSDGFTVVANKDKIEKKKDECTSDCKRTTGDKKMSQKGIDFLKGYESEVKKNGKHVMYNDDLGHCTIGYGHLVDGKKSCKNIGTSYKNIYKNGLTNTQAENLLKKDIEEREKDLNKIFKDIPLCQQEFNAFISLYYNIPKAFKENFTIMKKLRKKDYAGAGKALNLWVKGRVKGKLVTLGGLKKRRKAEEKIFGCGIYDSTH